MGIRHRDEFRHGADMKRASRSRPGVVKRRHRPGCPRLCVISQLLLVCAVAHSAVTAAAARHQEIDYDKLEKAWERGDAPEELRSDADDQFAELDRSSESTAKALGPQMVFVTLRKGSEASSELAARWKEMLWNGGVDVTIYEIETEKLLVGLQKGMFIPELKSFLREQREVVEYEWDGTKHRGPAAAPRSKRGKREVGKKKNRRAKKPNADASSREKAKRKQGSASTKTRLNHKKSQHTELSGAKEEL